MQRIRCNPDDEHDSGWCVGCIKISTNSKVYRLSCLRWKITDVKLFKPGQVKERLWTRRWADGVVDDIDKWEPLEPKYIQVTEGYTGQSVVLKVRKFIVQEGDELDRTWVSGGEKKRVRVAPFAIVDAEEAKVEFERYIRDQHISCCHKLLGNRGMGDLLWETYDFAIRTMTRPSTSEAEKKLLASTLKLWMSVRLTTKSFEIVGDEKLGMPQDLINDRNSALYHKTPLPPVMGAQIDTILIHQLQPQLRRATLEELQKMTQDKKQKTWLVTYLVTFILLHNISMITEHDAQYAKKHDLKRKFAREDSVKEYNLGANTLLAYHHYCCKGVYPFAADCRDQDLQNLAELDDYGTSFVQFTRQCVSAQKAHWEHLWQEERYGDDYYYISQLYEQNWQPRVMA